jgi:hypothetical protein
MTDPITKADIYLNGGDHQPGCGIGEFFKFALFKKFYLNKL